MGGAQLVGPRPTDEHTTVLVVRWTQGGTLITSSPAAVCANFEEMSGSVIRQLNLDTVIRERVRNGYTHEEIASELQRMNYTRSTVAGLSKRSVTRYCSQNNIHYASRLRREELDDVVEQAVYRVCGTFPRLLSHNVVTHTHTHMQATFMIVHTFDH